MTADELDQVMGWAAEEGWNPGVGDAAAFRAADPDGFRIGLLGGEPVAAISAVAYGGAFGFIGLYICRPEHRGHGHGWRLWQDGMARLSGRTVGLDGVVAQQANYRRSGFELAHRNIRYGGRVACERPDDPRLVAVGPSMRGPVAGYDAELFGAWREAFLARWLAPEMGRRAFALVERGAIRGYGVVRPAIEGFKIGPLFAEGEAEADMLFRALAAEAEGEMVFLDPPEPNGAATALAERHGLSPVFETARMYRGRAPALPLHRIFGITSFELG